MTGYLTRGYGVECGQGRLPEMNTRERGGPGRVSRQIYRRHKDQVPERSSASPGAERGQCDN